MWIVMSVPRCRCVLRVARRRSVGHGPSPRQHLLLHAARVDSDIRLDRTPHDDFLALFLWILGQLPRRNLFPCVDDRLARCVWDVTIKCPCSLNAVLERKGFEASRNSAPNKDKSKTLSDDDDTLDMTVVCSGDITDEIKIEPLDQTRDLPTEQACPLYTDLPTA